MQAGSALAAWIAPMVLSACASSLKSWDSNHKPMLGVPVRAPVLAHVVKVTTYQPAPGVSSSDSAFCTPDTMTTLEILPMGSLYYLNVDPATFGKAEFNLEFSDAGMLTAVGLNSDPQVAETATGAAGLLSAVLPFVAAPKAAEPGFALEGEVKPGAQERKDKNCLKTNTTISEISEAKLDSDAVQTTP